MRKKKVKEQRKKKKEIRNAKRLKKKVFTTLDWLDVLDIADDQILLKDGTMVRGIKIKPRNIFIDNYSVQRNIINNLRLAFNKIPFKLYFGFVFTPVDMDEHMAELLVQMEHEENPVLKKMIRNDIEKANWFMDTHKELGFYIMVKGKDIRQIEKEMDFLIDVMTYAGFTMKKLDDRDFYDYLAYIFENESINDFYFSRGVFKCLQEDDVHDQEERGDE